MTRPHTTHYDDCGCQSAALRDGLNAQIELCAAAQAEAERWKEVARALAESVKGLRDAVWWEGGARIAAGAVLEGRIQSMNAALARFEAMDKEAERG